MIRSLKTLGLALVAVLALSAVVASAASAKPKLTPVPEEYPVTLKGSQTVVNVLELEKTRPTECAKATVEATIENKAEAETSEATAKPTYSECTTTILGTKDLATVTMNECDYKLKLTETTAGTIKTEGWEQTGKEIEVKCPAGKEIEIHVFTSETKDKANEPLCTYKIAAQKVGGDLDYKLLEKNAAEQGTSGEIGETIEGVEVTKTSGTLTNCGAASQKATLTGRVRVEGFNAAGAMLRGIWDME